MPYNFTAIEKKWQEYWLTNRTFRALEPQEASALPKAYVLDMFPYPSGAGLHVGHPLGYIASEIVSRYLRMRGYNVLHPMGWDAFGLPAEQYAIKTNTHPRETTEKNIANFRRQLRMLGLAFDWDREIDTTDPRYYKWTQWIFLQLFNSYFDPIDQKARPIAHMINELQNENLVVAPDGSIRINPTQEGLEEIAGEARIERLWRELSPNEQQDVMDAQRLAYTDEIPVNWCPALGTVLANEEVIDGKSEVGGFPIERRPMRQWLLRITAYADRLLEDLDKLDWPEPLKEMQRNWIGRSEGAHVDFEICPPDASVRATDAAVGDPLPQSEADWDEPQIRVFTTRPDTLYGATYMVLAPEHPLVDRLTPAAHRETVEAYRTACAAKSERERIAEAKDKTGAFIGAYAINPVNDERIPIFIADYVLMGYGTGAIMAVPAHDQRDFEFARKYELPIRPVVMPGDEWLKQQVAIFAKHRLAHEPAEVHLSSGQTIRLADLDAATRKKILEAHRAAALAVPDKIAAMGEDGLEAMRADYLQAPGNWPAAFTGEGTAINSPVIDGLPTPQAKARIIEKLEDDGSGHRAITYKLRDWLFSRQRYWGEPFPILLDEQGNAYPVDESELPIELPAMSDFKPTGTPQPPLSKAKEWVTFSRDGKTFYRETNTMPQWAGSCWYYLRYLDPHNDQRLVDPEKEKYWMPVDLYVGGVEHAVLHLLYSRFWHKVLFDLGHVSSPEPFQRLVNQGFILGQTEFHVFERSGGQPVSLADVRDVAEEVTSEGVQLVGFDKATGQKVIGRRIDDEQVDHVEGSYRLKSDPHIRVDARSFKMSKSRGNVVNPDEIVRDYGADTLRLYEMYLGPLETQKPWNTRDIVGMSRFLSSVWRNIIGEDDPPRNQNRVSDGKIEDAIDRQMHRTIKKVGSDIEAMRFNTAIAELIKLNNEMGKHKSVPRELAENFTLMLAPFAPHIAEEIWHRLGHERSLAARPWPTFDPAKLQESTMEIPVQVNGKLRDKITVPADADESAILQAAAQAPGVRQWINGKDIAKQIYVPGKLVNLVLK